MIESLSFKYVDQLSGGNYGVTPNIDKIIREGLTFVNFFAMDKEVLMGLNQSLQASHLFQVCQT